MTKLVIIRLLLAWIIGFSKVYSQTPGNDSAAVKQTPVQVFAGIGYGSNLIYYGTSLTGHQPYLAAELLFAWKEGFWAGAGFFHLPGNHPFITFSNFIAGYSHAFNQVFDISTSISRFNANNINTVDNYADYTFFSASLGIDWVLLYTSIKPGWLFSHKNSFYLLIKNSHYFFTPNLGNTSTYFSFNPGFSFMLGTYAWLSHATQPLYPIRRRPGLIITPVPIEVKKEFRPLDMQLSLPIALNTKRISLELEPAFFYNFYQVETMPKGGQFFFTTGIYFKIN